MIVSLCELCSIFVWDRKVSLQRHLTSTQFVIYTLIRVPGSYATEDHLIMCAIMWFVFIYLTEQLKVNVRIIYRHIDLSSSLWDCHYYFKTTERGYYYLYNTWRRDDFKMTSSFRLLCLRWLNQLQALNT